ncbi:MAG: glycogen synthase [Candidatus Hydrogenedentota bacterium]
MVDVAHKPMRIGVVGLITIGGASSGTAGGVEKLIEEVTTRQAAAGHDVTVYVRKKYNTDGLKEYHGVKLVSLPAIYTKHLEAITHSFLSMIVAIWQCEVIQFHSMGPAVLSWIPRLFGRKTVCTLHGLDYRRDKWGTVAKTVLRIGEWCALHFPNRTTVVSRFLERHYPEAYGKDVVYIPNGVPAIPHRPLQSLSKHGLEPGKYILYLGRIVPEKGAQYLVPAFRAVDTDMKLAIVGDARHAGEFYTTVRTLAEGDDRIVFTGALYGADKEEAFSNAYLFCLPSDLEGLPIVLLEAMGNGRCCLTSDIPEVVEVIDPPRLGYPDGDPEGNPAPHGVTFKKADLADLAAQLTKLIENPVETARLGESARNHVLREYNWDAIAQQYLNVYHEALHGTPNAPA